MPERGPKTEKVSEREWVQVPWAVQPPMVDSLIAWFEQCPPEMCSLAEVTRGIVACSTDPAVSCYRFDEFETKASIQRLASRKEWHITNHALFRKEVLAFLQSQRTYIQNREDGTFKPRDLTRLSGDAGVAIRARYLERRSAE